MPDRYRTVLIFGAPGVGKGTQGKMLGNIPGFHHFSTGDMFRKLDPHSELGKTFVSYSTRGELVPDELTVEVWKRTIDAQATLGIFHPHCDLLILDGIPRSVTQTELMERYIDVLGILLLEGEEEAILKRLKGRALQQGRPDDAQEEIVRRRLAVYADETKPVLSHYPAEMQHRVDALGTPATVLDRIIRVVAPIQESHFPNALDA